MKTLTCDVLVVGLGPAGSSITRKYLGIFKNTASQHPAERHAYLHL